MNIENSNKNLINILIFPGGSEIGLEINNALKYSKHLKIFGGTSVEDHSGYVYINLIPNIPYVTDPNFITVLNSIIKKYNIHYIYPALDNVQMFLTEHQKEIISNIITSPIETIKICYSKLKTYEYFSGYYFIPKIYYKVEDIDYYPIFIKPCIGNGSKGAIKIENNTDLICAIEGKENYFVICEYLPGIEYTIDCFTDNDGELRVIKTRKRSRIKGGISVCSKIIHPSESITNIAKIINNNLIFKGAWFFQLKESINGNLKLLEVAARIPGTMGLSRNCGINFPLLTLFSHLKKDIIIIDNLYDIQVDRALISRYKIPVFGGYKMTPLYK